VAIENLKNDFDAWFEYDSRHGVIFPQPNHLGSFSRRRNLVIAIVTNDYEIYAGLLASGLNLESAFRPDKPRPSLDSKAQILSLLFRSRWPRRVRHIISIRLKGYILFDSSAMRGWNRIDFLVHPAA
jgi:hypothetical protein